MLTGLDWCCGGVDDLPYRPAQIALTEPVVDVGDGFIWRMIVFQRRAYKSHAPNGGSAAGVL
jgi:hypothetical protein